MADPRLKKVLVVLLLMVIAIFVFSKLDWWATNAEDGFLSRDWSFMVRYWAWQNAFWMLFGLTVATAYWAGAEPSRKTKVVMVLIFTSFGLVLLSNLLDWMYFWFNHYAFPPIDQDWSWMPQSWILGLDWGTVEQARWTVGWLFSIPLLWLVAMKWILPRVD